VSLFDTSLSDSLDEISDFNNFLTSAIALEHATGLLKCKFLKDGSSSVAIAIGDINSIFPNLLMKSDPIYCSFIVYT